MKFNLKTIGLGLAGLLGVLVLAVVAFFVFFPKELAAREAERRIEEATGRELTLGDKIEVSFWPALGFSVDQATLSNPEGFSTETPFLAADRIVFAVAVMPLLSGHIQVKRLLLEGAALNLAANKDGAANWAFPTDQTAPEQKTTIEDLRLDDVRLERSRISFDGGDGAPIQLENVDASLALESLDKPAQLDAVFDYRGQRLDVSSEIGLPRGVLEGGETPLKAHLRTPLLSADLDGNFNVATGALVGRLGAQGSSLRRLMAWFGSPMGEGGGFGAFRVAADLSHVGADTTLDDATLTLDAISATGRLKLMTQEERPLRVEGALRAGVVDVNPYLPAPTQTAEGGVEVDTAWSTAPLDLSGLRALDANLNLTLEGLKFQRMSFSDVALALRVARGAADARLSHISLYGGGGTARLIADGSGATPRVAFELDTQNIQAEPLLRDAIGFEKIAGRGRLAASLVGQGASQAAIMHSLTGSANFLFNDGQWKGVNLAQVARTVQQALTGQAAGQASATDFAEMAATLSFSNGVGATQDLRLLNPFVRLEGTGVIDVGAQSIDMRIAPRAVRTIQGQGGDTTVAGLGIPFRVRGPWAHVSFSPALGDVVQNELRNRAQEVLRNQPRGSVLSQLGETLFGRQPEPASTETTPETQTATGTEPATPAADQAPAEPAPSVEQRARDALGGLLQRATRPREEPAEPAPAPETTP